MVTVKPKNGNGNAATGKPVDASGGPTVDPTENVKALTIAEAKRQDDLREAAKELTKAQIDHIKEVASLNAHHLKETGALNAVHLEEIGQLREDYQEKIAHAESGRLDSIRQVDREEVAKTAVAANTAIQTLAKQTTDLQQTLAKQVTDTAAAQEARNSTQYTDVNKRLSALELSSSEGKGKSLLIDPQMDKLTVLVEALARNQATGAGKSEGISAAMAMVIAIATLGVGVIGSSLFLRPSSSPSVSPQVIYVPAPAGALAPAAAPKSPP